MNGNGQMEVHYIDTGFPYTATESFMDFFEGLTHAPVNYGHAMPVHDQASAYWSMNMHSYKFGLSGPGNTSYYGPYEVNPHFPRMDMSRRAWEYPLMTNSEEPATTASQPEETVVEEVDVITEESIPNEQNTNTSQVEWEENIDPDNMTYEELLDLGEAVGTQSRGLSDELISLLPTTKYKCGSFFSRKKSGERCVICQARYKRGARQMKLPCNHFYHSECISKWLGINKICPVCNLEVFAEESRH
ncbi:E3 ubiquitin-protein ligase BIG BROTHER [Rosa rugosa]|uniref:E3 ubiquitin-protein ligase BIG BROTHER n=1 Tax=Rosa rugosa TaxID=74645 RepID=UPI002B40643D|nr:E3 ubiquitin-protein ligase BIG BROTHER [Rosa rugosa]XP_061997921.1 E3 ubiquitin-protein ligase BIG BROTHER [Rosa rugosa]XP_061997922.1 E3 ubiquitin-protein ligase BIG BROTHER [Rosa rugosa]XP_061997923.1 E3 ubiquitin-protein ligase BIG BROTHER [Rosa rugosa]XP_061997924.1 E3 ubiquitin-protein ligase BIG BROTHER [Rosa rugosa]